MNHSTDGSIALAALEASAELGPIAHLPIWEAFEPARVLSAATLLLEESEIEFTELEANLSPSWAGLMLPLERLQIRLGRLLGSVAHLLSVKYSDELQAAYDEIRPRYVALSNRMSQSRAIYEGMLSIQEGGLIDTLEIAQQRVLGESVRGMVRSGVHLEGEAKSRYEEIQQRLSALGTDFQTNLVKEEQQARKAEKGRTKQDKQLSKSEASLKCQSCNSSFTIKDLRPGSKHHCPQCDWVFTIS